LGTPELSANRVPIGVTTLTGANNITGADPALGGLAFNGGPTPTNRPSNAVEASDLAEADRKSAGPRRRPEGRAGWPEYGEALAR